MIFKVEFIAVCYDFDLAGTNFLKDAVLSPRIMVAVACVCNNLSGARTYPQYWWPSEAGS